MREGNGHGTIIVVYPGGMPREERQEERRMKKRVMGWLLALVMAATLLPVQALAAGVE